MRELLTPGVSFLPVRPPRPAPTARTDVAGFVGIAERGPLHRPERITSWREFRRRFGDFLPHAHLAYTVRAFFENGGRACWIVRVADNDRARPASVTVPGAPDPATLAATGAAYRVEARSPGTWGNGLAVRVQPAQRAVASQAPDVGGLPADRLAVDSTAGFETGTWVRVTQPGVTGAVTRRVVGVDELRGLLHVDGPVATAGIDPTRQDRPVGIESVEFTILVLEAGQIVERHAVLAPDPAHSRDAVSVVDRASERVTLQRLDGGLATFPLAPWGGALAGRLEGGRDGLAELNLFDHIGAPGGPAAGLAALADVDEVAILAMPDLAGPGTAPGSPRRLVRREPVDPCDPGLTGPLRAVRGVVRDAESGRALPGATVTDGRPDPTVTDERGSFSLAGLPGGSTVDVIVHAAGYADALLTVTVDDPAARALDVALVPLDLPAPLRGDDLAAAQLAMVEQCERLRDRFCVLDPPPPVGGDRSQIGEVRAWRARFSSPFAALYYPWPVVSDPRDPAATGRPIPPSGHVAGLYAATDLAEGVFRPPANRELRWIDDLADDVGDAEHGVLNPLGINALRASAGRGIRVQGARTLAAPGAGTLAFVNVRRFLNALVATIRDGMQWAVFEPNDEVLRGGVRLWLTTLLDRLWRRGALVGDRPEAAYVVRCDATTTTPDDAAAGRLVATVAVAPTVPYEFVVIRLGLTVDELQVSEV